jgi:hypothetical protein
MSLNADRTFRSGETILLKALDISSRAWCQAICTQNDMGNGISPLARFLHNIHAQGDLSKHNIIAHFATAVHPPPSCAGRPYRQPARMAVEGPKTHRAVDIPRRRSAPRHPQHQDRARTHSSAIAVIPSIRANRRPHWTCPCSGAGMGNACNPPTFPQKTPHPRPQDCPCPLSGKSSPKGAADAGCGGAWQGHWLGA